MKQSGNGGQWGDGYPAQELLENDIREQQLYVYTQQNAVHGVFAFILGDDPNYAFIESGSWKNNAPYGTIHRIASDGRVKGVFEACLAACKNWADNIRIDTHANNFVMQHLVEKHGFEKCGIVYMKDGSPRIAYQYIL